jgi:hexulose-6-phosphate isomerase
MSEQIHRRDFLVAAGQAVGAAAILSHTKFAATAEAGSHSPKLKKAVKIGMVEEGATLLDKFKLLKDVGFEGIDMNSPNDLKLDEVLEAQEKSGLKIHGVVDSAHWKDTLSHPDPEVRAKGLSALKTALKDAKAYGASSVLLVCAVVNKDVSYADAYERSQSEIRKALPLAEELGINLLLENVWNNFHLSPLEMARYIDELESPMVGAYFDVGNVVKFGWPEHWIRTLGKRVVKLDIKEYSRTLMDTKGPRAGFDVEIGDGDCDWPAVMQALRDIGYNGWATAEVRGGNRERLQDISTRMDKIFAT